MFQYYRAGSGEGDHGDKPAGHAGPRAAATGTPGPQGGDPAAERDRAEGDSADPQREDAEAGGDRWGRERRAT